MPQNYIFLLLGVMLQSLRYAKNWEGSMMLSAALIMSGMLVIVDFLLVENWDFNSSVLLFIVSYSASASFLLKERMLPKISELSAVILSAVSLHSILYAFSFDISIFDIWFILLYVLISLFLALIVLNITLHFVLKLFIYVWFLLTNVVLIVLQLINAKINIILKEGDTLGEAFSLVLLGMVIFFLVANISYIKSVFPIPSKYKPYRQTLSETKEHISLLVSNFTDRQLNPIIALTVFALILILLFLNTRYNWISNLILVNALIIATQFLPKNIWKS